MSYRVHLLPSISRKVISWSLPDALLVEVYIRLREDLPNRPLRRFLRTRRPFDGMTYRFDMVDPENRLCRHWFVFQVVYSADEESLLVVNAGYRREVGI